MAGLSLDGDPPFMKSNTIAASNQEVLGYPWELGVPWQTKLTHALYLLLAHIYPLAIISCLGPGSSGQSIPWASSSLPLTALKYLNKSQKVTEKGKKRTERDKGKWLALYEERESWRLRNASLLEVEGHNSGHLRFVFFSLPNLLTSVSWASPANTPVAKN